MSQYMLLFSLGPVQSFIAQARKTRDLWLGSFLLSTLMEAGMEKIDQSKLIFPADPKIEKNIPDLPNKYIAIFDTLKAAQDCADGTEKQIKIRWESICEDVWKKIIAEHVKSDEQIPRTIWDRQTDSNNFFEMFWVITKGDQEKYSEWLGRTQAALDARKRLRPITIPENTSGSEKLNRLDEPGEKSTISGEREALHGTRTDRKGVQEFWVKLTEKRSPHDISMDGSERLDAIDTVKRFAYHSHELTKKGIDAGYPSTSSIATATFVERLLKADIDASAIQPWMDATTSPLNEMPTYTIPYLSTLAGQDRRHLAILERDGDCYFQETFTSHHLQKDHNITPIIAEQRAAKGREALRTLLKATDGQHITRPTPYYAMIQMDGDKMGILLSGVKDKQEHMAISSALSGFSRESAPPLIEQQYPGRLIYAGGDDVFALAPLARDYQQTEQDSILTVLDLVDRLQHSYQKALQDVVPDNKRKQEVTASVGIAIAHHYTSLSYVRRMSKEAESSAKNHYGRNALVVTVLRRSGEQTRVGCRWHYDYKDLSEEGQPIKLFTFFYKLFKEDVLSQKCVYNLLEEAHALVELPLEAQKSEIKRVLKRQCANEEKLVSEIKRALLWKESDKKSEIECLAEHLVNLAAAMDHDHKPSIPKKGETEGKKSVDLHSEDRRYGLVEVLGWLLVMVFLARKEQD